MSIDTVRHDVTLLGDQDLHLFNEGTHGLLYQRLGSHPLNVEGMDGAYFAVWAPNAERVSVVGDFNGWDADAHELRPRESSGVWEGFVAGVPVGSRYKYRIHSHHRGYRVDKADPFAVFAETPPKTASIVWTLDYSWNDADWMRTRRERNAISAPISIYEMHIGSWSRPGGKLPNYRDIAPALCRYVNETGFTHVELLPVMEHPFYGSWGYQTTGYFAPTSRYGTPQDFMFLVDALHQAGIGVILDWVPSHFPTDEHGLAYFDGTHLFEHADMRLGYHPDWNSYIFNYGRNEVRSFLVSSALHWLDTFHADGLRVDAVASMLYLDYSRAAGEWIPNEYGGRENLDAIRFLRDLNVAVYREHPDVQTYAEESTAWPMVSRPTYVGGLGFGFKWDMGWMHDTLSLMSKDPLFRRYHHNELTFRSLYAFNENFVMPLSHDEVVHGKGSLIGKMPGDDWQKLANLRLLFGYMTALPGKKLVFMGGELGQWKEWNHEEELDWTLLDFPAHDGLKRWVSDLNRLYRREPALHRLDADAAGFEWVDANDAESSVVSFLRKDETGDAVLVVCNFTPMPRPNYRVGVPTGERWIELLNSDAHEYGGSGHGNYGGTDAVPLPMHGRLRSLTLTLPPLGCLFLKHEGAG
jgi:1,4-alpha-glucan branching enzyme